MTAQPPKTQPGGISAYVAHPKYGPLPAILVALTIVTGLIDALSILALGRVFVANMTGNVVFTAFAIAGAPGYSLWGSLVALIGFLVGAGIGGAIVARSAVHRGRLLRNILLLEFVLTLASLAVAIVANGQPDQIEQNVIVALASFGLGLQNTVVRHLAVPDMTTTVLTMALTGLGADIRKGDQPALARRLVSIMAMFLGGLLGAVIVLDAGVSASLTVIAIVLIVLVVILTIVSRKPANWQGPAS
jgi:uncharacterized membrane protein YoaK (UPF0700 family)